ncbi:MAG: hypothetical protein M1838_002457 [Thelocarpon superellum]|nr:MAG: hypothetical protein M1838_002457 [Thelocarpon superellum]
MSLRRILTLGVLCLLAPSPSLQEDGVCGGVEVVVTTVVPVGDIPTTTADALGSSATGGFTLKEFVPQNSSNGEASGAGLGAIDAVSDGGSGAVDAPANEGVKITIPTSASGSHINAMKIAVGSALSSARITIPTSLSSSQMNAVKEALGNTTLNGNTVEVSPEAIAAIKNAVGGASSGSTGTTESTNAAIDEIMNGTDTSGGASSNEGICSFSNITTENIISNASQIEGYNVYLLSFWTTYAPIKDNVDGGVGNGYGGAMDSIEAWTQMPTDQRKALVKSLHDANIAITFTCFGSEDGHPDWTIFNTTAMAAELAELVVNFDLDGVDFDFEDFTYMENDQAATETFLSDLTHQLRLLLPRPYIISHSVPTSFFNSARHYGNGSTSIPSQVDDDIDYYNSMMYWAPGCYDTCDQVFVQSGAACPGVSIGEIVAQGIIAEDKLLVGIPADPAQGGNKFSDGNGTALGQCLASEGTSKYGGVATWLYSPVFIPMWIENLRKAAGW